ncbi:MAG: hypothetical protein QF442_03680, partial [Candidatus Peribacteraceae bacterium]|nr:hypothetical protein [Candidatus Peribacteraceae bacterium]
FFILLGGVLAFLIIGYVVLGFAVDFVVPRLPSSVEQALSRPFERNFSDAKSELMDLLSHFQERDIVLHSTTIGPHRDDWKILVDGRDISTFASRGQQRTAVLALLFLQVSYLELQRGEKPVILLDDVFSELDDHHQKSLLSSLEEHQVIITTTHIPSQLHGARVLEISNEESIVISQ